MQHMKIQKQLFLFLFPQAVSQAVMLMRIFNDCPGAECPISLNETAIRSRNHIFHSDALSGSGKTSTPYSKFLCKFLGFRLALTQTSGTDYSRINAMMYQPTA